MTLAELQQALHKVNPAAVLVTPQVIERVIQEVCHLPALPWDVPHRKSYVVDRQDLFRHIEQEDLNLSPEYLLPPTVILLVRPTAEQLTTEKNETLLGVYWRRLFHAAIHQHLEQKWKVRKLTLDAVRQCIEQIGQTEFTEIRRVLIEDHWIPHSAPEHAVYIEFVAVFMDLHYFAANLLPIYFPSLGDLHAVRKQLGADLDVEKLFNETRLEGAPDPVLLTDTSSDESHDYYWKLAHSAARAADSGNLVRAAILRTKAARVAPANLTRGTRADAERDMNRLARRLETALDLTHSESVEWARDMCSLLDRADQGNRPVEADLLFNLQQVVLDAEQGIFALSLIDWVFSGGRRPIKRPLPAQRQVRIIRHLREAAQRLTMARLSDNDRQHLLNLIRSALAHSEERLRVRFRPIFEVALQDVGLVPTNPPERTAFYKIIEELLDRVVVTGYLTFSDLRDVIARNQLKLPDLRDPQDFLGGDPLLRLDRRLFSLLDGVYRPSELYNRTLERLTALNFGTKVGRLLTTFVTLPFIAAFLVLRSVRFVIEETTELNRVGFFPWLINAFNIKARAQSAETDSESFSQQVLSLVDPGLGMTTLENWLLFATLGLYFLALWHSPAVRAWSARFFIALGRLLNRVLIQTPLHLARLPLLRRLAAGWPFQLFYWFFLKPFLFLLLLYFITPPGVFRDRLKHPNYLAIVAGFIVLTLFVNSSVGRQTAVVLAQAVFRASEMLTIGLFKGLYNLISSVFKQFISAFEAALFSVDEWLRFRTGERRIWMGVRLVLGVIWYPIGYFVRFYMVVLIEPMLNPLKLPVCLLAGKLMLPILPLMGSWFAEELVFVIGWPLGSLLGWFTVFLLPDLFGYLFWELKENWSLYTANRSALIRSVVIGSHGETMLMLLEPGIHSGTIPRLFARWRRAERAAVKTGNWRVARAQRLALQDIEQTVRLFAMRNLVALVHQSRAWGYKPYGGNGQPTTRISFSPGQLLSVGRVTLARSQIRIEMIHARYPKAPVWLEFEEKDGWLVAAIQQTGWLTELPHSELRPFNAALVNLYKLAGVDLVLEQIHSLLPPGMQDYDIKASVFVLWRNHRHGQPALYSWNDNHGQLKPLSNSAASRASLAGFIDQPNYGPASADLPTDGTVNTNVAPGPELVGEVPQSSDIEKLSSPASLNYLAATGARVEAPQFVANQFMFRRVPFTWQQHVDCWQRDQEEGEQPRLVSIGVDLDLVGLARNEPANRYRTSVSN